MHDDEKQTKSALTISRKVKWKVSCQYQPVSKSYDIDRGVVRKEGGERQCQGYAIGAAVCADMHAEKTKIVAKLQSVPRKN
ncbi:hypothetical protein PVK06_031622 [Gossypium arboreum]|uniref:Uncharacterized protein n=1 Tax=Gossypium arboreum TaxID=29729 RepID=A0ABR0NRL5_GOSAR|nr:hypothetical protein PVK06_031622 [Gossypium arboreum]